MTSSARRYDAIVVGCGPVGAVAALHLARAGLEVAMVEEHLAPYPYPRAVMLDAYSCAILAEILEDDFERVHLKPTPGAGYYLDKDDLNTPFASTDLDIGDRRSWFVQPQLESLLREVVERHRAITTFWGSTARKLFAHDVVCLTIQDLATGEVCELTGDYLLGCDGGNSFVRKQAGGRLISLGGAVQFLVVDARVPADKLVGETGHAYQIVDQDRPTTYLPMGVDDHCRWEFRINPDDDILELQSPERILELLEPWADRDHIELIRHTVYKFNSLIAADWRFGNVFLCGDAAHQTSPFLGQGLNMGIRNTRNLCQKIDLVASGTSRRELLDRYQAECFDDTKGTIKEALRMGKLLFNTSAPANALRSFVGNVIRRGEPIDITKQIAPTTRTLDIAGSVPAQCRKVLPHVRVELADEPPTMLTLVEPTRPKVLTRDPVGVESHDELWKLAEPIRPALFRLVDRLDTATAQGAVAIPDGEHRAKLFGDAAHIVLLENSVVLGQYASGDEQQLVRDYATAFQLVAGRP